MANNVLVSDIEHVIGGFNASLERNYAVCMDEALFRGQKKAMERLKSFVTEPTITIEHKAPSNKYLAGEFEPPLLQEKRNIPSITKITILPAIKFLKSIKIT